MRLPQIFFIVVLAVLPVLSSAAIVTAGDFDWIKNFNTSAEANLSDFKARLAARFKIAGMQVEAVLSNCQKPADAYVVCVLVQTAGMPPEYFVERYRSGKDKGWGGTRKEPGYQTWLKGIPCPEEWHRIL